MRFVYAARFLRTHPHLISSLVALLMLAVALTVGEASAESVEQQYIYAVAPLRFMQKYYGDALQREAFRHADLLPFYGSSELEIGDPFHVSTIFRLYPTGFTVFPIGGAGAEPLIYLQRLAAAGGDLRGKKVIISLSPQFFTEPSYWANAYDTNFSRLSRSKIHGRGAAIAESSLTEP